MKDTSYLECTFECDHVGVTFLRHTAYACKRMASFITILLDMHFVKNVIWKVLFPIDEDYWLDLELFYILREILRLRPVNTVWDPYAKVIDTQSILTLKTDAELYLTTNSLI